MASRPIKVYVGGRVKTSIRSGRLVSEFGKSDTSTFVLVNRAGSKVVKGTYALRAGDTLVVTQRGVGG